MSKVPSLHTHTHTHARTHLIKKELRIPDQYVWPGTANTLQGIPISLDAIYNHYRAITLI